MDYIIYKFIQIVIIRDSSVPSVSIEFYDTVHCSSNSKNVDQDEFLNYRNQREEKEIINDISVSTVELITLFHSIPCTSEAMNEDNERVIEVGKERVDEELKNC